MPNKMCNLKGKSEMKIKMIEQINAYKTALNKKLLYIGLMLVSSPAFAVAGKSPLEDALEEVILWLTGPLGISAGTLAIIGAGFAGLTGRMPMAYLKTIGISLGLMYSAAFLASLVTGQ